MAVITDSGGITEETTVLGVLRDNTERSDTVTIGANELGVKDPKNLESVLDSLFSGRWNEGDVPEKWDGKMGKRIAMVLEQLFGESSA